MSTFYSDLDSVAEALCSLVTRYDTGKLDVVKAEAVIDGISREEMQERNLFEYVEHICHIHWDSGLQGKGPVKLTVHFHENQLSSPFSFRASGGQYSRLAELNNSLARVEGKLSTDPELTYIANDSLGLPRPDFAEINSGSMSGGFHDGLSDREFKYEVLAHKHDFEKQ